MFIAGKGVDRLGEENSLIGAVDLFSTIAELAGINKPEINDSKSFKSLLSNSTNSRAFQYAEMNNDTRDLWTISNGNFKLIVNANGEEEMYDLVNDPYEQIDLLEMSLTTEAANAKIELEEELQNIRN
jgi:arylsulfatase A-like enzyme